MKKERNLHLLETTNPLPAKKLEPGGGYKLWAIGKKSSFLLPLASCFLPSIAQGQSIVPAADGTGTVVTPNGNRFDIQGGQLSGGGTNLFHSFQRFGLNAGQIGNFISPQTIRNILARVTGGEPSIINGLIQITGGSPNLFLMNPAGIVFGPNAQLNLPASFLATTSSGIGFGDKWFNAFGPNNYSQLIGTPSAFAFPNQQPGAIVNAGNLAVKPGENLTLLGGTVVSVGTLAAPGGTITLVAVPGEKVVRISQEGRLLNLEVAPLTADSGLWTPEARLFSPLSLPQMLTGGGVHQATGVAVNDQGQVVLTGGKTATVTPGTAIVAGTIDASISDSSPSLQAGGTVEILGDRIFLNKAKIDVSGNSGGGTVEISGINGIQHPAWGMGTVSLGPNTNSEPANTAEIYVSNDSVIAADARVQGDGGHVTVGSWGGLTVNEFHGQISAHGGHEAGNGGAVEVSGGGIFAGSVDLSANGTWGTVQLNADNIVISPDSIVNGESALTIPQTTLEHLTTNADVSLQANNNITINNLSNNQLSFNAGRRAFTGSMTFVADADRSGSGSFAVVNPQTAILTQGGVFTISGENITLGRINANGGAINLTGDQIHLVGGASSVSSVGGSISIAPRVANQGIEIGGSGSGNFSDSFGVKFAAANHSLTLSNGEMEALSPGFKSVTIGRYDGTGAITVNAVRVDDTVTIQSPGGTIAVQGEITGGNHASISLNARETSLNANITTNRGDINLNSGVTLRSDVSLSAGGGGNIAIAGSLNSEANQAHNVTLTAGTGNISFGGAVGAGSNGELGKVLINSADQVTASSPIVARSFQQLSGTGKTSLGEVRTEAKEGINISTRGDIVAGNVTANGGEISLTSQAGNIGTGTLNSAATSQGRNEEATIKSEATGGNIALSAAGNVSTGSVISLGWQGGGNVSLNSTSGGIAVESINAGSVNGAGGSVTVNSAQYFHTSGVVKPFSESAITQGDFDGNGQAASAGNASIYTGGKTSRGAVSIHRGEASRTASEDVTNGGGQSANFLLKNNSVVTSATTAAATNSASLMAFNQVQQLDGNRTGEFARYLGRNEIKDHQLSGENIQASLGRIAENTGKNTAVIYVVSRSDHLELSLVSPKGSPVFRSIPEANQEALRRQVQKLIGGVSRRPTSSNLNAYLSASQQLYQWMVAPLEDELRSRGIDTLAFSLDPGMRTLPLAALHDGQKFLVQKYSLGLIPSINLTDTSYHSIKNSSILAMGAAEFKDPKVVRLPAVPLELSTIRQDRQGRSFLNQEFTLDNLRRQGSRGQFGIMHLATHGSFDMSNPSNSYIQLWDGKLRFDQLRELGNQGLELLVLSACETAFGNSDAELGFAGLAVQSGVKSVLASLWQVDDAGTLGLMSEFYRQLNLQGVTVKAEALRQAQIAMIDGDLRVEGGQLRSASRGADVSLPSAENQGSVNLSHPYYWASFTMIGSPW